MFLGIPINWGEMYFATHIKIVWMIIIKTRNKEIKDDSMFPDLG